MDRGVWFAIVHGVAQSDTAERLTLSFLYLPKLLTSGSLPG